MKKALIIIAAIFLGLGFLALVGSVIEKPAQVVMVDPEPTPVATLTNDEQRVYDFIATEFPELRDMNVKIIAVLDGNGSYTAMVKRLTSNGEAFIALTGRWNDIDWGYGQVSDLEDDFDAYMNASRAFYRNWVNGISGGNVDQCATNAVKAELKMEKLVPRIEEHLAELDNVSY
jgi:hypothetical protein